MVTTNTSVSMAKADKELIATTKKSTSFFMGIIVGSGGSKAKARAANSPKTWAAENTEADKPAGFFVEEVFNF